MEQPLHEQLPLVRTTIDRKELFDLHNHYESVVKDELDFFFKYLNFYIGMLSALLAGTLTGLLSLKAPGALKYTLLLGPLLIIFLAFIGYQNVRVYYRRFLEALVTIFNIKNMLGLRKSPILSSDLLPPIFPSRYGGGFITQFNRPIVKKILDLSEQEGASAEDILEELLVHGDTLKHAKYTFVSFCISAVILALAIIITPSPHC